MSFIPIFGGPAGGPTTERDFGPLEKDDLIGLARIGYDAIERGDTEPARAIFQLLVRAQPENAAGEIGLALIDFAQGASASAMQRLKIAAGACTVSIVEAKATLAMLLAAEGRLKEAAVIRTELLRGPDSAARRMVLGLQVGSGRR